MEVLTGPYTAAVGLLLAAGVAKALRPAATARALTDAGLPGRRFVVFVVGALGAAETAVSVTAVVVAGPVPPALVAVCYLGFAWFVALGRRRGTTGSCGCFGVETTAPPGVLHLVLNVAAAGVAVAVALGPPAGGAARVLTGQPLAGLPLLAATAVCGWLAYLVLSALPEALAGTRTGAPPSERAPAPLPDPVRLQPGPDPATWLPGAGTETGRL